MSGGGGGGEEDERTVEGRGEKSRGKGGREEQGAGEG